MKTITNSTNYPGLQQAIKTWIVPLLFWMATEALGQSVDWTGVIWREPQVRYILADLTLNGGKADLYRKYAKEERDPDSREAMRLWDAGVRVVNTNDLQRRWVANRFGTDGRVMRIVHRGTERTITGNEVVLSNDGSFQQGSMRLVLLDLTLGARPTAFEHQAEQDAAVAEALRRFNDGCRVSNAHLFQRAGRVDSSTGASSASHTLFFKGSGKPADPAFILLNSDLPYPETNVRYFMADIALGGSIEFYRTAAERAHEMGCLEAVRRTEDGFKITNLDQFERKKVEGMTLITRKGSNNRISGMDVKLSSD